MGTHKKDKADKPKKHKHKHQEKHQQSAEQKHKEQQHKRKKAKKQQEANGHGPSAAVAAGGSGSSDGPELSSDDIIMTQPAAVAAAATNPAALHTLNRGDNNSSSDSGGDSDVAVVDPQQPGSKRARKGSTAAAGGDGGVKKHSVAEVLQQEGFVGCEVVGHACELDLQDIHNPDKKELWVLRLPDGVDVDELHGRHIHIPTALPDARHLRPPPNPFTDPDADLLSYVQAAVPAQNIGHMSLGAHLAHRTRNHQHRELLQEHEFEAMTYSVIAAVPPPAAGSSGSNSGRNRQPQLQLLKVGRFVQLPSDTALVDKHRVRGVSNAGAANWAAVDGWDGQLLPRRKPRRRIAGWEVVGGSNGGSSSGDEEYEEDVFLSKEELELQQQQQQKSEPGLGSSSGEDSSDSDSDNEQRKKQRQKQQHKQQQHKQQQQQQDTTGVSSELDPRLYSDLEEDEDGSEQQQHQQRELEGQEEDRPLPGGNDPPFAADLQQWLLSLPVVARTSMLQDATAQLYSMEQWGKDRCAWWGRPPQSTLSAQPNAARQAELLQQLEQLCNSSSSGDGSSSGDDISSSSDDGDDDDTAGDTPATGRKSSALGNAGQADDVTIVVDVLGQAADDVDNDVSISDEDDDEVAAAAAGTAAAAAATATAAGGDGSSRSYSEAAVAAWCAEEARKEYPCPLPLSHLVSLPSKVEEMLGRVKGSRTRQRMRNACVKLFTDWRDVWVQVDKHLLDEDELWQLVEAMPRALRRHISVQMDRERTRRMKQRQQQAAVLGAQMVAAPPAPRPDFIATDQGYAPYQAQGEPRVAAGADAAAPEVAAEEDDAMARWLLEQGAGQRVRLVGAEELRNRGFDWDDDPEHLRREGLHVVLPNGRDVHIPAGTDLDWQGLLREAWGYAT